MPRREVERHAGVEIFVAEDPADAARVPAHGSTRKVEGSGTIVRFGEPVISSRPMPPPRVNEENVRAFAESSVVVATLML